MMFANIRKFPSAVALVLCFTLPACSQKPEPAPASPPKSAAQADNPKTSRLPHEPTEAEIRELVAASVDELNRQGGIKLSLSATGQPLPPIKVRFDGYEKVECKPYTVAWRCDGKVSFSYPGTELPAETLSHSRRLQKDATGKRTMD